MNIYPVQMSNLNAKTTNFKAKFISNQISEELVRCSSKEDVANFNAVCEALKTAKNDNYSYFLSGVTSNYGVCCGNEVNDKFIGLNYKTSLKGATGNLRNWILRTENIVSGGYEKQNLLKEITQYLKNIVAENSSHSTYNSAEMVVKKATFVSKVI